jgi:hypothetical protein
MTAPTPRADRRCWCGDGRYASPVDLSPLTDVERARLKRQVGIPHACRWHRDFVEAKLLSELNLYRERVWG